MQSLVLLQFVELTQAGKLSIWFEFLNNLMLKWNTDLNYSCPVWTGQLFKMSLEYNCFGVHTPIELK